MVIHDGGFNAYVGLAVTETVMASSKASLREKLAMRNVALNP